MLCDSKIEAVVGTVKDCHRGMIVQGTSVILVGMATASPFVNPVGAPTLEWGAETPFVAVAPKAVHLHWGAQGPPIKFNGGTLLKSVHAVDPCEHGVDVPAFCLVQDKEEKINKATGPRPVHLFFWHLGQRTLELQADTHFTETKVTDALAREIVLNAAKTKLVEHLDLYLDEEASDECFNEDSTTRCDPQIASFTDRLKVNIDALVKEARSAPEAFSLTAPTFSTEVEDGLREAIAKDHRSSELNGQQGSLPGKQEALAAPFAGAAATGSSPTSARPSKAMRMNGAPISATKLAGSLPLVLCPFEDINSVFGNTEIMTIFKKTVLSRNDCVLCQGARSGS